MTKPELIVAEVDDTVLAKLQIIARVRHLYDWWQMPNISLLERVTVEIDLQSSLQKAYSLGLNQQLDLRISYESAS